METLALESIFNKVEGLHFQPVTFVKKETPARVFSVEFCEILKKTFSIEQLCFCNCFCNVIKVRF